MTPFKTPATARGLHAATALLAVVAVASAATVFFLYPDITVDRNPESHAGALIPRRRMRRRRADYSACHLRVLTASAGAPMSGPCRTKGAQ